MKAFLVVLITAILPVSLQALSTKEAKRIKKLELEVKELNSEISELKLSVDSLNRLSERLSEDFQIHEESFKSKLSRAIIHLMQWPARRWGGAAVSWSELQRLNFVLEDVRGRLVRSPLSLMAEREIRLDEVKRLTQELAGQVGELESKQALLDVQLEELRNLERRVKTKVPHASGRTKNIPKDAEPIE